MTRTPHLIELKEISSLPILIEQIAAQAQCVVRLLQLDGTAIIEKYGKGPVTSANCLAEERCREIVAKWSANPTNDMNCGCGHPLTVLPIRFHESVNGLLTMCPYTPEQQSNLLCLASVITNCLKLARNAVELWSDYSSVLTAHRELYRETESPADAESILRVALQIVQKYLKADIVMYLPRNPGDTGWGQPIVLNQVDASDEWLDQLSRLIMISHDEDRCPLIILSENKTKYPQFTELKLTAFVSVTVFCESETLGRLVVCSRRDEATLSLSALSLLEMLSDTIGLRIHDFRTREHKQRFLNRALHHLNTPAHSIGAIARQLTNENLSSEERERSINDLIEETERLVRLSKRAQDLSTLQKVIRSRTRLSVKALLENAVHRFGPFARTHGVSIKLDTTEGDVEIEADEEALQLALQSLLENAIKFSPSGTSVSVVLKVGNENFSVRVIDEGPGVPESQRNQIFEELVSIPRGEVRESTGMGLTIARLAIEDHGGSLNCFDTPSGRGICFSFTIPISNSRGEQL